MSQTQTPRTFRGRSLQEVIPKVRADLGDDAIVLRRREGLVGGVGGFFQRPYVEVEAAPAQARFDAYDEMPEEPFAYEDDLVAAAEPGPAPAETAPAPSPFDDLLGDLDGRFSADLAMEPAAPAPAPAAPEIDVAALLADEPTVAAWAAAEPPTEEFDAVPEPRPAPAPDPFAAMALPAEPVLAPPAPEPVLVPEPVLAAPPVVAAPVSPTPAVAAPEPVLSPEEREAEALRAELVHAGLSSALATELVGEAADHLAPFSSSASLRDLTRLALGRRIPVAASAAAGGRTVVFAGPGGCGKSTLARHLAAAYARGSALGAVYVAFRAPAAAAAKTLAGFGVPVVGASSPEQVREAAEAEAGGSLVVVDTPASPADRGAAAGLAAEVHAMDPAEVHAVVPATLSGPAGAELIARMEGLAPTHIALSHADETGHVGPAIGLAIDTGLPLSYVLDGPALAPADAVALAARVLP